MQEWFKLVFTKFTEETIIIAGFAVILLGVILIAFWLYNRRKFHRLGHQIPASVVKNYLDSIIQNSTALKSSLFRGGGLDVGGGVPSVVPVKDLGTTSVSSGPSYEELNQKNAEISSLQSRLTEKERIVSDLERKTGDLERQLSGSSDGDEILRLQKEIEDLKARLQTAEGNAGGGGGDTAELERQLAEVTKERDQLKERLMEYEIIEEDLANLKRLQQENEQLKKSLAALQGGGAAPPAVEEPPAAAAEPAPEAAPEPEPPAAEEPAPEPEPEPEPPAAEEPAPEADVPENAGPQKTAEELLGEFEKMLG